MASLVATSSSNASGLDPTVEDRAVSRIALDLIDCRQVGATPAYIVHIPHLLLGLLQLLAQVQHGLLSPVHSATDAQWESSWPAHNLRWCWGQLCAACKAERTSHVAFHRLPPFDVDVAITRTTKQPDSLHLGHLVVPTSYICANQVEDPLQRRYQILRDVVFSIQLRLLVIYESLRLDAALPESSPGSTRYDNIRHSLAILRFSPGITEHSLGRYESTGRRRAFVRISAEFDLFGEAEVLNAYAPLHDLFSAPFLRSSVLLGSHLV
ncbi:putative DNA polymerase zeta catalytic subunit [Hortaea werneckii]|nr:putative DNA polymerase zeta catalytic subunit [Hortaea werneckii]